MSSDNDDEEAIEAFLRSIYPDSFYANDIADAPSGKEGRLFVTLTYAQSLDAKIGVRGRQLILSGPGSMKLTHRLRALHSAILVGIGTVLNEDPSLTCRIPHLLPVASQPQPYILDSHARLPLDCKLIRLARDGIGKAPCVVTLNDPDQQQAARVKALRHTGCRVMMLARQGGSTNIPLRDFVANLPSGTSLMVEGGSAVISSFLSEALIVDRLVITTAPMFVGDEGVAVVVRGAAQQPSLQQLGSLSIGQDTVVAYSLASSIQ